jgi:hypothetical protein
MIDQGEGEGEVPEVTLRGVIIIGVVSVVSQYILHIHTNEAYYCDIWHLPATGKLKADTMPTWPYVVCHVYQIDRRR